MHVHAFENRIVAAAHRNYLLFGFVSINHSLSDVYIFRVVKVHVIDNVSLEFTTTTATKVCGDVFESESGSK